MALDSTDSDTARDTSGIGKSKVIFKKKGEGSQEPARSAYYSAGVSKVVTDQGVLELSGGGAGTRVQTTGQNSLESPGGGGQVLVSKVGVQEISKAQASAQMRAMQKAEQSENVRLNRVLVSGNVVALLASRGSRPQSIRADLPYYMEAGMSRPIELSPSLEQGFSQSGYSNLPEEYRQSRAIIEDQTLALQAWERDLSRRQQNLYDTFGYDPAKGLEKGNVLAYGKSLPFQLLMMPENIALAASKGFVTAEMALNRDRVLRLAGSSEFSRAAKDWAPAMREFYNPKTPEGLTNIGFTILAPLAPFASKGFRANVRATAFLKSLKEVRTAPLKGEVFYGETIKTGVIKGGLRQTKGGLTIERPGFLPVEERVFFKPKETITLATGKNIRIFQPREGLQVVNVQGAGRFRGYTLRTITDVATGKSESSALRTMAIKSTFLKRLGLEARGRYVPKIDYEVQVLKKFSYRSSQGLMFTESSLNARTFQELKTWGYTQRSIQRFVSSRSVPLSRKGFQPLGRQYAFDVENVQVGEKVPKIRLSLTRGKSATIEIGRTEFEIVDYPVKPKTTIMNVQGDTFYGLKPVEFKTQMRQLIKQKFLIDYFKPGRPPKVDLKAVVVERPESLRSSLTPELSFKSYREVYKPMQFRGTQAYTYNPSYRQFLDNLRKYDPNNFGGDRIRPQASISQEISKVKVQAPVERLTKVQGRVLRTDYVPKLDFLRLKSSLFIKKMRLNVAGAMKIESSAALGLGLVQENLARSLTKNRVETIIRNQSKSMTRLRLRQQTTQMTRSVSKINTLVRTGLSPSGRGFVPRIAVPPPTPGRFFIPPFFFPKLGGDLNRSGRSGALRITKYTPSFGALYFNIRGRYKKGSKLLAMSGFEFRPITPGYTLDGGYNIRRRGL